MDEELEQTEAELFFDGNYLVVAFGEERCAIMDLETEEEAELVKTLLADPNFWAQFLTSLSAGIKQTLG